MSARTVPELAAINRLLLAAGLSKSKLPEELVIWSGAFPYTDTGKLMRLDVSERARDLPKQVVARLEL